MHVQNQFIVLFHDFEKFDICIECLDPLSGYPGLPDPKRNNFVGENKIDSMVPIKLQLHPSARFLRTIINKNNGLIQKNTKWIIHNFSNHPQSMNHKFIALSCVKEERGIKLRDVT